MTGSFAFCREKALSLKQADLGDSSKKTPNNCTSTVVVSSDPLSPTPKFSHL